MLARRSLLLFLGIASVCLAQEPEKLDAATLEKARATFAAVSKRLEKVVELHAGYIQEQESLLLAEPLVSTGTFHLRLDPGCLVLRLAEPSPAVIRSDATSHRVYDPASKRAEVFLFEENRLTKALIACFRADLEQVESIFRIAGYAEAMGAKERDPKGRLATVQLLPKTEELQAVMRSLTLTIDLEQKLPVRVTQINREGEAVAFELEEAQLLEKPHENSAEFFQAKLPEGTRVVERRVDK